MATPLHVFAPAPVGGMESVVATLTRALVASGTNVHAHVLVDDGAPTPPLADALRRSGVAVHRTDVPPRRYDVERSRTRELCRRHAIDVVHCHGYRPDVIDAPAARALGIPVVSTVHGFTGGGWRNAVYEWLQLRSLRRMDRVVAVSRPLVDLLGRRGVDPDRVVLLRNAWARDGEVADRAEARHRLGLHGDAPTVGWIGRMSREKGPDVALAAARAGRADLTWVLVGDGPERATIQAAAGSPEFGGRLVLPGLVPDAGSLVRAFDVLVLSSRTEGTPIVALEAMAAGVPVVATAVGGVPDLVGAGAGVLVAPEDPRALADAVERVVADDELRASLVRGAHDRLDRDYAVRPWVDAHLALYAELTGRRR